MQLEPKSSLWLTVQPRGRYLTSLSSVPSKGRPPKARDLTPIRLSERRYKERHIATPEDKGAQADPDDPNELSASTRGCSSLAPGLPPSRDCGPGVHTAQERSTVTGDGEGLQRQAG